MARDARCTHRVEGDDRIIDDVGYMRSPTKASFYGSRAVDLGRASIIKKWREREREKVSNTRLGLTRGIGDFCPFSFDRREWR